MKAKTSGPAMIQKLFEKSGHRVSLRAKLNLQCIGMVVRSREVDEVHSCRTIPQSNRATALNRSSAYRNNPGWKVTSKWVYSLQEAEVDAHCQKCQRVEYDTGKT